MSLPATLPERSRTQYQPYLDGLRGVAILGVLADHFHLPLPPVFHIGPVGVRFFFVLSGYFITLSLWKVRSAVEKAPHESPGRVGHFYLGRLLRVGPPFYLALLVGVLFGIREVTDNFWWLATFNTNHFIVLLGYWPAAISHYWSLAVQEQFYIVWPLVVLAIPRRHFVACMLACLLFALGFRMACIATGTNEVIRWVTLAGCLDSFAAGALIASFKERNLLEKVQGIPRAARLALPLVAMACYFLARIMTTLPHDNACLALAESLDALFLTWLLVASLNGFKSRTARFLGWPPLIYLGRISYGVYVYHVFIIILLTPLLLENGWGILSRSLVLLAVTLLVSSLSWHWLEQPIMAWKKNLGGAARPLPVPTVAKPEPATASVFA